MPSDTFDRADSVSLGADWNEDEAATTNLQIVSNRLKMGEAGAKGEWAAASATMKDQTSALIMGVVGSGLNGPAVRMTGGRDTFTGYTTQTDGFATGLRKYVNQSLATGGTVIGSASFFPAAGDELKVEVVGNRVKVFVAGVERINVVDNDVAQGKFGVAVIGPGGGVHDWNSWTGADLDPSGGGGPGPGRPPRPPRPRPRPRLRDDASRLDFLRRRRRRPLTFVGRPS